MGGSLDTAFEDVAFHHAALVPFLRSPVPDTKKASRLGGFCLRDDFCRLDWPRPNRQWLLNTQELNKSEANNHDAERDRYWLHDSLPNPIEKLLIMSGILP
jgi:diadenosine tetraphosphatase ApaH/serine/threonine PP2A family protein phosphatase